MESQREFGSDGNGNPKYGREAVGFFFLNKKIIIDKSWPLDWRGCFGQGIKWDDPSGLNFGFGIWRLYAMSSRRL
jgi:hypothetical protein